MLSATSTNVVGIPSPSTDQPSNIRLLPVRQRRKGILKCRVWPSGDFSLGVAVPPKVDQGIDPLGGISRDEFALGWHFEGRQPDDDRTPLEQYESLLKWIDHYSDLGDQATVERLLEKLTDLGDTLGLSVAINSHKSKSVRVSKRGGKGITTYGKRMIRSAAVLLEERYQGRIALGTCTLPALSPEQFERARERWPEITRQFFQELGRELCRNELPKTYVYCTEIQPERFEKWGQVAPHLHFLFVGRKARGSDWKLSKGFLRDLWARVLLATGVVSSDCGAATRIEVPRGSVAKELGKYISKGGEVVREIHDRGMSDQLPASYWGASLKLKRAVKSRIAVYSGEAVEHLMDNLDYWQEEGVLRYRPIMLETEGKPICLGACGYFFDLSKVPIAIS